MKNNLVILLSFLLCSALFSQTQTIVLVAYYSEQGHTKALAEAVAVGIADVPVVQVQPPGAEDARGEIQLP